MLLKTIDEKFTALVNAKLNSYEKVIGHDVLEIVKVVNDDDRRVKTVTVRDKREGMDQEPFDVEVDYFETEGRLLRDIYLPTGITAERVAEILHYDYFWDLTTEFVVEQLGKEPMVKGDKVIELKNTVKYYQDLNLHFVDSVSELPEALQTAPATPKPYTVLPHNCSASNFLEVPKLWFKAFNTEVDKAERIEAIVDIAVLSNHGSGDYVPNAAQRVHWKLMDSINVYLPRDFTNNRRAVSMTVSGGGSSLQLSFNDEKVMLSWYKDWPTEFCFGEIVTSRPAFLDIVMDKIQLNKEGKLEWKEGEAVDLSALKDIDGKDLISEVTSPGSRAFSHIKDYTITEGYPLVSVNLETSLNIYSSWATHLFKRQVNWGATDFDHVQSVHLAISTSRSNAATALARLLREYTRSPELVKISGYGKMVEVNGKQRYKKYLRISVKGLKELEGKYWDVEISAPFASPVITAKESDVLTSTSHTADKLQPFWLDSIVKSTGADVGGTYAFIENLYGIFGMANQLKAEYAPMVLEVDGRSKPPFSSTVFLHSADPKNFGKMTRKIDKDAKTATYTIEGTDSVLIITDADKHMLVEE